MLFTSVTFYFYFLPVFLLVFRAVSARTHLTLLAKIVLIVGTYFFYGFENTGYLIPFVFATVLDLVWSQALERTERPAVRKLIVTGSVIQNLSLFLIFKYLNAIAIAFPDVVWLQSMHHSFAQQDGVIPLPPGISFYLFESLSFVIDCYRRTIRTPRNPFNFLVFISMFPRFIAGPIVRYADLQDSIVEYKGMRVADGLSVFMIGFILKTLLADSLAQFANAFFGIQMTFWGAWIGTFAYTLQLYIDFSAYSMMAVGLGLTIGFPFLDNFREPYSSLSITEFWRRWHISLSSWLRDYLYIPLGGSRHGRSRTLLNLFLTMAIGGIWHGASLTFVAWGAYHGILLIFERVLSERGTIIRSRALTFLLVMIGWVFFRANSFEQATGVLQAMTGIGVKGGFRAIEDFAKHNRLYMWLALVGVIWVFLIEPKVRSLRNDKEWREFGTERVAWPVLLALVLVFVASVAVNLSATTIPFLYFQF